MMQRLKNSDDVNILVKTIVALPLPPPSLEKVILDNKIQWLVQALTRSQNW